MEDVIFDDTSYNICFSDQILPPMDPVAWLQSQSLYPKVYWKEKGTSVVRAAVGSVLRFPHPPRIQGPSSLRLYGGQAFRESLQDQTWAGFPRSSYWLPALELSCEPDRTILRRYTDCEALEMACGQKFSLPNLVNSVYTPTYPIWKQQVKESLQRIREGSLQKVVLARKNSVTLDKSLDPCLYLSLIPQLASSTIFLFQLSPQLAFLGATPELLFKKQGQHLITEAIAGTRKRGLCANQDLALEQELLSHPKEIQEFQIVKQEITRALASHVHSGAWQLDDVVLKSSYVQHLYNRFEAELKGDPSLQELLSWLHPTPALGGFPREVAAQLLEQIELFDRGWYGSPIGVVSSEDSAFYVAIRSMLWKERLVDLFSGAGIIAGSCPEKEWEELNAKLGWFYGLAQPVH